MRTRSPHLLVPCPPRQRAPDARWAVSLPTLISLSFGLACVEASAPAPNEAAASRSATEASRRKPVDLSGRTVDPREKDGPAVLLFVRTDCPISNRYAPTIGALQSEFGEDVRLYSVFVEPDVSRDTVAEYMRSYTLETIPVLDPDHYLVARTGATVTPEAALFDGRGELAYRGRIDNKYVSFGRDRPRATEHDLADAIRAVLAGEPVKVRRTKAVGCYIADLE